MCGFRESLSELYHHWEEGKSLLERAGAAAPSVECFSSTCDTHGNGGRDL